MASARPRQLIPSSMSVSDRMCNLEEKTSFRPCVFNETFGCTPLPDGATKVWVSDSCRARIRCDLSTVIQCGSLLRPSSSCVCPHKDPYEKRAAAQNETMAFLGSLHFIHSWASHGWTTAKPRAPSKTSALPPPFQQHVCQLEKHTSPGPCILNQTFGCTRHASGEIHVWVSRKCRGLIRCDKSTVIQCGDWRRPASRCPCQAQTVLAQTALQTALQTAIPIPQNQSDRTQAWTKAAPRLSWVPTRAPPITADVCTLERHTSPRPCVKDQSFGCVRSPIGTVFVWVREKCRGEFQCAPSTVVQCGQWWKHASRCACEARNTTRSQNTARHGSGPLLRLPAPANRAQATSTAVTTATMSEKLTTGLSATGAARMCVLEKHTSPGPCVLNKTFGCTRLQNGKTRVWVRDRCRGLIRCDAATAVQCGEWWRATSSCACSERQNTQHETKSSSRVHGRIAARRSRAAAQYRGGGGRGNRECRMIKAYGMQAECVLGTSFGCVPSTRGSLLIDIVVSGTCQGLFSCGGLMSTVCYPMSGGKVGRCLCPPTERQALQARMVAHGNFSQQLLKVVAESEKSKQVPRVAWIRGLHGWQRAPPEPIVPAPPKGCEKRLLRSPLLSTEHTRVLRSYYQQGLFRQNFRNTSSLFEHARASSASLATRRYRSCAVVGSSSKLLDRTDGDKIDSAELVFRLNNAPTPPQLHKHVGSRTDVYFDAFSLRHNDSEWCPSNRISNTGECLGARTDQQIFICWGVMYPDCLLHRAPSGAVGQWDRTSPGLELYARSLVYGPDAPACNGGCRRTPSSGIIAILLALHRCDQTYLYGFGSSPRQPCAKYYAQQGTGSKKDCRAGSYFADRWHNMPLEHAWLRFITNNFTNPSLTCHVLPESQIHTRPP